MGIERNVFAMMSNCKSHVEVSSIALFVAIFFLRIPSIRATSAAGCRDGTVEFSRTGLEDVVACQGTWITQGITNGASLCSDYWEICRTADDLALRGFQASMCDMCATSGPVTPLFYGTLQSGNGDGTACTPAGANGIWGCGCQGPNPSSCSGGILGFRLNDEWQSWQPANPGSQSKFSMYNTDATFGGVMCCRSEVPWCFSAPNKNAAKLNGGVGTDWPTAHSALDCQLICEAQSCAVFTYHFPGGPDSEWDGKCITWSSIQAGQVSRSTFSSWPTSSGEHVSGGCNKDYEIASPGACLVTDSASFFHRCEASKPACYIDGIFQDCCSNDQCGGCCGSACPGTSLGCTIGARTTTTPLTSKSTSATSSTTSDTATSSAASSSSSAAPSTTLSMTTTTVESGMVECSLILEVSNAEQFVAEDKVEEVLREAVAALLDVIVSWIQNLRVELTSERRLQLGDEASPRQDGRRLESNLDIRTRSGVKIDFDVVIPPDGGPAQVTATLVMQRFDAKTLNEASDTVDKVLKSGVLGSKNYEARIVVKKAKVVSEVPTPAPAPANEEDSMMMITIAGVAASSLLFLALAILLARWIAKRGREHEETLALVDDIRKAYVTTFSEQELLFPREGISPERKDALSDYITGMLDSSHPIVYVCFAIGHREGNKLVGLSLYFAAAVIRSLYEHRIPCFCSSLEAMEKNAGMEFLAGRNAYMEPSCKMLLILDTCDLYRSDNCLEEIYTARKSKIDITSLRFEIDLPSEEDRWSDPRMDDIDSIKRRNEVVEFLSSISSTPEPPNTVQSTPGFLETFALDVERKLKSLKSFAAMPSASPEEMGRTSMFASVFGQKGSGRKSFFASFVKAKSEAAPHMPDSEKSLKDKSQTRKADSVSSYDDKKQSKKHAEGAKLGKIATEGSRRPKESKASSRTDDESKASATLSSPVRPKRIVSKSASKENIRSPSKDKRGRHASEPSKELGKSAIPGKRQESRNDEEGLGVVHSSSMKTSRRNERRKST